RSAPARPRDPRLRARDGATGSVRAGREDTGARLGAQIVPRVLTAVDAYTMLQQAISGVTTGGIYASVALAVVMIYRAIDHFNFAQGEMAMFSTYIAWSLMHAGLPYWCAFIFTLAISVLGGVLI